MSETQQTVALLAEARRVLREVLMPQLPGGARFEAAMVANVMAIAARSLELGEAPAAADAARLAAFLGAHDGDVLGEFCRRIRAGRYDDDAGLIALLEARTADRLAISNPGYGGDER